VPIRLCRRTLASLVCIERTNNLKTFSDFNLNPAILKTLEQEGYATPTPIQLQAIPSVLEGRDLQGIAQTGTGKTAAFALPILHRLAANKREPMRRGCRVLVLSPTRELCSQICDSFRTYGRNLGIKVAAVYGGVGHRPQIEMLARGVDVLVATPGRLLDHVESRHVALEGVETFVLDEADQMLDMGFIQPIRRIISKMSMKRQTLFFSATMPKEIGRLAAELLQNPVKVSVTPAATTVERVRQHVYLVDAKAKRSLLVELFANPELTRTIVFTRTKRGADKVARHLEDAGISNAAIHGNKSQGQRQAALAAFKASRIRALVATDVAARGIDIELVTHVVNFELPNVPESYVHRIGRTARAGAEGVAISLCDAEEREFLRDIEHLTRQSIPATDRRRDPTLPLTEALPGNRKPQRGSRGEGAGKAKPRGGRNQRSEHRRHRQDRHAGDRHVGGRNGGDRHRNDRHGGDRRPEGEGARNASPAPRQSYADQVANGASLSNVAFLAAPSRPAHAKPGHAKPGHATQRDDSRQGQPRRDGHRGGPRGGHKGGQRDGKGGGKRYSSQGGGYRAR
jgi:ATP-dependent RNA helicase RhlE